MARIVRVEIRMVDLVPLVKRTDAIQAFVSQETPLVTITDAEQLAGAMTEQLAGLFEVDAKKRDRALKAKRVA